MHRSIGRIAALLGAGALALAAVSPVAAADDAMVRVLHASPDAPAVDVYANDGVILEDVPFGVISNYLAVPGGTYNIKVCVAGSDATDPANCVINEDLPFDAGKMYTVAATDLVAQIKPQLIEDAPADDAKNAQIRVVHFSADTPPVDVLTEDGGDLPTPINGLAFSKATGYLALPADTYDLKVCVSGEDPLVCPDAVNPGPLPVEAGTAYTVFAIGSLTGGEGVAALQLLGPIVDATFEADDNGGANATTPPTSTIAPTTEGGSSNGSMLAILGLLGIAGLATVGMSRRFATRRVEK